MRYDCVGCRFVVPLLVSFGVCLSAAKADDPSDQSDVVSKIVAAEGLSLDFDTLFLEGVWLIKDANGERFEHTTLKQDNLKRLHYRVSRGPGQWHSGAKTTSWEEWICDGELVAKIAPVVPPAKAAESAALEQIQSLLSVNIFDLQRKVPMRNGLTRCLLTPAAADLKATAGAFELGPVRSSADGIEQVSLTWKPRRDPTKKYVSVAKMGQLNRIVEERVFKASGELHSEEFAQYKEIATGIFVPESWKMYLPEATASIDSNRNRTGVHPLWQEYVLLTARFNDPGDFPESTFELNIPKGSIVWDKRLKVDYIAGRDDTAGDDRVAVALAAKERQAKSGGNDLADFAGIVTKALEPPIVPAKPFVGMRFWLITINAVAIVVVAMGLWARQILRVRKPS